MDDFFRYKDLVEQEIEVSLSSMGPKTLLRDACAYALTNGGKRLRPLLVLEIASALGKGPLPLQAALSVEFFHTSSLIADDLPCMDNDDERRDKPSLHKVFGETVALLASYALLTKAFELIYNQKSSDQVISLALHNAAINSGILGATGGQFLDLFPPSMDLRVVQEVIYKKTITLFEVSFVFGWLFGGGDVEQLDLVKKAAYHLGMAFQIRDDLGDIEQYAKKMQKVNMALTLGSEKAKALFLTEMDLLQENLQKLHLMTKSLRHMCALLSID